ncbi:MAG: nitrogen regulation protein NR(II) [Gammaproteobacteria bacterium]|nr:nitrogen regulation protein NR(II) [Gammaproteobacteria bacterium]
MGNIQRTIVEHQSTAIILFDLTLKIVFMNSAAEAMLGVSIRQAKGCRLEPLLSGATGLINVLQHAFDSGQRFTEREVLFCGFDLQSITVDCTVTPASKVDGHQTLLMELQQIDHHLRVAKEANLLSQQQASQDVVRGLAHEIKNPLGGLRGAAQLLERELDDISLKEYTQIIIGEADRLSHLMNRMLGPNTLPSRKPLNIHELLEHVNRLIETDPEFSQGITVERDYDPSIPDLTCDQGQLIQALLNVVRNAAQALEGNGHIIIKTRACRQFHIGHKRHKLVLKIDIVDNGPGIVQEMLEKVFFPMVTGRADGTGLGLSIAQSLVNQHGGLIECTSVPGKTAFTLLLPLEYVNGG